MGFKQLNSLDWVHNQFKDNTIKILNIASNKIYHMAKIICHTLNNEYASKT